MVIEATTVQNLDQVAKTNSVHEHLSGSRFTAGLMVPRATTVQPGHSDAPSTLVEASEA